MACAEKKSFQLLTVTVWAALVLGIFLSACSSTDTSIAGPNTALVNRLKNRGPVTLSTENPFLAGNLLVSKEMERSEEMRGFIRLKGAPAAIEVEKDFFSPLIVQFYYPENRQQYTLELAEGVWIIRGPLTTEREKMKEVAALLRTTDGKPKLESQDSDSGGEKSQSRSSVANADSTDHASTDHASTDLASKGEKSADPFLERLEKATSFKSPARTEEGAPSSEGAPASPMPTPSAAVAQESASRQSSDAQSIAAMVKRIGAPDAEISPQGDLVHYVTYSGETLSMIARWYTYDRQNADKLARINNLQNPHELSVGDMIIVPSYLVQNKSRLSEKAVSLLSNR